MAEGHRRPTPDHPPYGEMISMAITTLKEEGGSTTASIDCFIKSKYKEELLPPAHSNLFPYHLNKLIRLGELQQPTPNTYILTPDDNTPPNPNPNSNSNPFPPSSPAATSKPPVKEPKKKRRRLNPSPSLPPSAPTSTPTTDPDPEPLPPPHVIHPHTSATAMLTPPFPLLTSATATLTPTAERKRRGRPPRQKPEDQEKEAAAASAAKVEQDVPRRRGRSLMAEEGTGTEAQQRRGMRRR